MRFAAAIKTLAAAVLATALLSAPALGADRQADVPPGVVVAGASPAPTLEVADGTVRGSDQLGLTLRAPGFLGSDDLEANDSEVPPLWPDEVVLVTLPQGDATHATRLVLSGAVGASAAMVEVKFESGRVLRLPTLAGEAYTGRYAGRVRFFLGEITLTEDDDDDPREIRMLDASGAVIGVANSPEVVQTAPLLRRRAGGAVTRIEATLTSRLAALPLAPEHRDDQLCLTVGVNGPSDGSGDACQDARGALALGGSRGCDRVPTSLVGFAPEATDTLVVRLGSGRSVRLPTRAAPFGRPGRIVAALLPRGEALRSAEAVDGAGQLLASGELRVAPPDRRCHRQLTTDYLEPWGFVADAPAPRLGTPPGTEVAALGAGGAQLLVRDADERLCVGIDRLDLDGGDCSEPPFNARQERTLYVDPVRGIVAGIYPAQVTAADLRLRGGGSVRIPVAVGLGYTGRYRDAVHFVFAASPPGRTVIGAVLLDAAGTELGQAYVDGPAADSRLIARPSTVLSVGSGRAAVRVVAGATVTQLSSHKYTCVGVELGRQHSRCDDDADDADANTVTARVSCATRRTVVFGIARHTISRVELTLSNGRRVRARLAAFPRGLGSRNKVFLAVLPRHVAITRVHFVGPHEHGSATTAALPTRAPSRQCGYETTNALF